MDMRCPFPSGKICCNPLTPSCKHQGHCFILDAVCDMNLLPDIAELTARARTDLRLGLPIVLSDASGPALVAAAETISASRLAEVLRAGPEPCLAVTKWRAATLKAHAYDPDVARISLRADTSLTDIRALADPSLDLRHPLKGPFASLRGGDTQAHSVALDLLKSAKLLPAALVVRPSQTPHAALTHLDATQVAKVLAAQNVLAEVAHARVPIQASQAGRVHVFRQDDGADEHYAIEIGRPDRDQPVLARLHSACFTGDVLGSLKCDCGAQLHAALHQMSAAGAGVLLYLNQEGRGIGLANKMRAYALQDQGFDTVDANHRLGFEDDERDFRIGAGILRSMGFSSVRLLTNNPNKIQSMQLNGIDVAERVPLQVGETAQNAAYLATKARRSGHLL